MLSSQGQEALRAAVALKPIEENFLRDFTSLCRSYSPVLAKSALETAILRCEAGYKYPEAEGMYFTRPALEQASGYKIASYRAKRMAGFDFLIDLGCSIGSDTRALAGIAPTIGIDLDALRLAMAQANLHAFPAAFPAYFLQADLLEPLPVVQHTAAKTALFFDPARRADGSRFFSVEKYIPPLSIIKNWLPNFPSMAVKMSPGVDLAELKDYDAELEFISIHGELKEAVLWFGELKTVKRRATILSRKQDPRIESRIIDTQDEACRNLNGAELGSEKENGGDHLFLTNDGEEEYQPASLSAPQNYFLEPDPAVIRAGLVRQLGARLEAAQIEPSIAYLTSNRKCITPFVRIWEVESWFPFNLKRLRDELRRKRIGSVIVKKRGSPIQPDQLIHDLRLEGEGKRVIFLTRHSSRAIVVICFTEISRTL